MNNPAVNVSRPSCISGSNPVYLPVAPVLDFAERVTVALKPFVDANILSPQEVQILIKLGPDTHDFVNLVDGKAGDKKLTPAQARLLDFYEEAAGYVPARATGTEQPAAAVLDPVELRALVLTPMAAQPEALSRIKNLLGLNHAASQMANYTEDGRGQWTPAHSGQGLRADTVRLMEANPEFVDAMRVALSFLDKK